MEKDVLTTGEVAKICNVAPRTVSKWFDSGQLRGYRIPGSKDRRIPLSELVRFMKEHGMPMEGVVTGRTRVLVADDDGDVTNALNTVLSERTDYEVSAANTAFHAGMECERSKPHVVMIDVHIGGGDGREIAEMIRSNESLSATRLIAMSGKLTDGQSHSLRAIGFDGFLKKPFTVKQAVDAIEQATAVVH